MATLGRGLCSACLLLVSLLALLAPQAMAESPFTESSDQAAVERFRAKDYASADTLWREAFEALPPSPERGRVAYNLGNNAYRRGLTLQAVGWYTVALADLPRDGDLWANLALARAEADLEPLDGGGLTDMLRRLTGMLTEGEARWLALFGLLLLALALVGEALRGGAPWRRAVLLALVLVPVTFAPYLRQALVPQERCLVTRSGGVGGRSEPRKDAKRIARLAPGSQVEALDQLPGWTRVRLDDGRQVWVEEDSLFALDR